MAWILEYIMRRILVWLWLPGHNLTLKISVICQLFTYGSSESHRITSTIQEQLDQQQDPRTFFLWTLWVYNVFFMSSAGVQFLSQMSFPEFLINHELGNLGRRNIFVVYLYISCFLSFQISPQHVWQHSVLSEYSGGSDRRGVCRGSLLNGTTLAFTRNEYADDWRHAVQESIGLFSDGCMKCTLLVVEWWFGIEGCPCAQQGSFFHSTQHITH